MKSEPRDAAQVLADRAFVVLIVVSALALAVGAVTVGYGLIRHNPFA